LLRKHVTYKNHPLAKPLGSHACHIRIVPQIVAAIRNLVAPLTSDLCFEKIHVRSAKAAIVSVCTLERAKPRVAKKINGFPPTPLRVDTDMLSLTETGAIVSMASTPKACLKDDRTWRQNTRLKHGVGEAPRPPLLMSCRTCACERSQKSMPTNARSGKGFRRSNASSSNDRTSGQRSRSRLASNGKHATGGSYNVEAMTSLSRRESPLQ